MKIKEVLIEHGFSCLCHKCDSDYMVDIFLAYFTMFSLKSQCHPRGNRYHWGLKDEGMCA